MSTLKRFIKSQLMPAEYEQDLAREQQAQFMQGEQALYGQAPQQVQGPQQGVMMQGQPTMSPGAGLMSAPQDSMNQLDYARGIMGLPGGQASGFNLMESIMKREDQQAADLETQGSRNESAMDRLNAQIEATEAAAGVKSGLYGGFDNQAAQVTARRGWVNAATQEMKTSDVALARYNRVNDMVQAVDGLQNLSTSDEETLARNFVGVQTPGGIEAFMGDDRALAEQLAGLGVVDNIEQWINRQDTGAFFDNAVRRDMFENITNAGISAEREVDSIQQKYAGLAQADGSYDENMFRQRTPIQPYQSVDLDAMALDNERWPPDEVREYNGKTYVKRVSDTGTPDIYEVRD